MTALGNVAAQRAVEEAVPAGTPETRTQAQDLAPTREASVATALPAALPLKPVTHPKDDAPSPAEQARMWLLPRLTALATGDNPLGIQPPDVFALWRQHREAAGHWNAAVIRYPRLAYGLAHTSVAITGYWLFWATFSPAGLVITAALLAAFFYWF
jgi:hypothetical protein